MPSPETSRYTKEIHPRRGYDSESILHGFRDHLKYTLAKDAYTSTPHDKYLALARTVRDRLIRRWIETQQLYYKNKVKRVYYLSIEYLTGRVTLNNIINLGIRPQVEEALTALRLDIDRLCEMETDPGLGNGGLGRLAACFLDSLATLHIPAMGYGLRYDYGIFRQHIKDGTQMEEPDDWLRMTNPWEIQRPEYRLPVHFGGRVSMEGTPDNWRPVWTDTRPVVGVPYDIPIVGYGGKTVNNLRLWSARAAEEFDFQDFNQGDYVAAVESKVTAENLTKVLYPNDSIYLGKELRLRQQFFFVTCSLQDILRRFKKTGEPWEKMPERVAIQLNDTHPSLAIPEMVRLLMDQEGLGWDAAWDLTVPCFAYTNHTLLPEALETWPVEMIQKLLPRNLQIIEEIDRRFLKKVKTRHPKNRDLPKRMSIIEESSPRRIRMANLSIVGSHKINGVARLHTELLKERVVPEFAEMFPERFTSKTNGITPRRWLLMANPPLADLVTEAIGEDWVTDLEQLRKLEPLAEDAGFRQRFRQVKHKAKKKLAYYMRSDLNMWTDYESLFDVHIKRIHEYKRQLLNIMHVVSLYQKLREDPNLDMVPRTFLLAGKAAPGYFMAKLIIKLTNNVAEVINKDPIAQDRLRVFFLPNYGVTLAQRMIPAADVSEQISQAGTEASGTGNMKFMLNGALTIGTLDGANIEMMEEVGRENMFIFGLTTDEVTELAPRYDPMEYYEKDPGTKETLDFLLSGYFSRGEHGIFEPLRETLLRKGDPFMHLADYPAYVKAQEEVAALYRDPEEWSRRAILNIAASGRFSSDRTIMEYANEIWGAKPCTNGTNGKES